MTHNRYISVIAVSGLISWVAWLLIVYKLDPYVSMSVSIPFFFLTLVIALSCTFTVLGFYFRIWIFKNEIFYNHINIAFRQGVFLGFVGALCLVFQMMRVLTWWSGVLLVFIAVLLESYFSSRDSDLV